MDDDPTKQDRLIAGFRVLGSSEKLADLVREHAATDVIICTQSISRHRLRKIQESCFTLAARTHLIPTLDQILAQDTVEDELAVTSAGTA